MDYIDEFNKKETAGPQGSTRKSGSSQGGGHRASSRSTASHVHKTSTPSGSKRSGATRSGTHHRVEF